jgi:molecular chaperone DnaK (HSP70)
MQGAFGVDLGSSRSVFAAATRGGVKILCNEGSNRETGNYVGYTTK